MSCTGNGARTLNYEELGNFKYRVAIPSPVLFSQFARSDTPAKIALALKDIGFDEVWDFSVEIELVNRAIREKVENWKGSFPLISSACPVVVRILQVMYPSMVSQVLPVEVPREIAGREMKKRLSKKLGLEPHKIAAIYITPCQAKSISILQPAEEEKSHLDGGVGISEIYNDLLYALRKRSKDENDSSKYQPVFGSDRVLRWGVTEGQAHNLSQHRYLPLTGLDNIIKVFDDIERGKLRNIDFIECYACAGGCIGGNLTVDNLYVARSKLMYILSNLSEPSKEFMSEVNKRYPKTDFSLKAPVKPRSHTSGGMGLVERVKMRKRAAEVESRLPGLKCGLCGAPNCHAHAQDIAQGNSSEEECIFLSDERLEYLRDKYMSNNE
ncbi:MAG: [Fe-Fe] hydrogenase large subunit C-terminal domain-containing protein [Planctomycetota bacterium]|nr:[Fe-Fe] hydrogenase large subunit C-terminal domain-containing protein [Planctomycetota bacterium]